MNLTLIISVCLMAASSLLIGASSEPCAPPRLELTPQPSMPTRYKIAEDVPRSEIIERAFQSWHAPGVSFVRVDDEEHGIVLVGTGWIGQSAFAGTVPGRPFKIVLNLKRLNPNGDPAQYERIIVHEIGHVLGLTHSTCPDSIMYAGGIFGPAPSPQDRAIINTVYPAFFTAYLPHLSR